MAKLRKRAISSRAIDKIVRDTTGKMQYRIENVVYQLFGWNTASFYCTFPRPISTHIASTQICQVNQESAISDWWRISIMYPHQINYLSWNGYWICKPFDQNHDDVIKWNHFPRNWPFVRGIHRSPVNSPHKGQWRGALMFSLICVWINNWVNNREAGDLRRYRAHSDVIVMMTID